MTDLSVRPSYLLASIFPAAFALSLLLGGGGAEGPLQNGIIAAVGAFLLVSIAATQISGAYRLPKESWAPAIVAVGLLLIPLVQLIPLPPTIWHALPGRTLPLEALNQIGAGQSWRPLSLDPEATRRTVAALLLPLALFLHVLRSGREDHLILLRVLVICAALSGLLGALQLALGHPEFISFYDGPTVGAASGIFANPNHQALLMAIGMVGSAMLVRESSSQRGKAQVIGWVGMLFFALMAIASGSRAGLMLLGLGLPGALLIATSSGSLLRWTAALVGTLAILCLVVLLYPGSNTLALRESFQLGEDARYAYLPDILYTLDQYWSVGSGLGTFVDVFAPNENLDLAQLGYLNHAHNDFSEWLIETGAVGAVWLGLAAITAIYVCFRKFRVDRKKLGLVLGPVLIVLLAALHSVADYPLRTASIASAVAFAVGLIGTSAQARRGSAERRGSLWPMTAALVIALPIAGECLRLYMVQWGLRTGQAQLAAQLGAANEGVLVGQASNALQAGKPELAEQQAAQAVIAQPMNAPALRYLALAREAQRKPAARVWQVASSLGWRDPGTQYWAFRQALADGEPEIASARADALLRTSRPSPSFVRLLRMAAMDRAFATAFANRIRLNPRWRRQYFTLAGTPSAGEVTGLVSTIEQLAKTGEPPLRSDGRSLVAHFIHAKAYSQAQYVDQLVAGDRHHDDSLLDDGGFDRLIDDYSINSTLFDWQVRKGLHSSGSVDTAPPTRFVADTDGERSEVVAERYARIPAGRYQLTYRTRSDASDTFRTKILCAGRSPVIAEDIVGQSKEFEPRSISFQVEAGCPLIRLVIDSLSSGTPGTSEFDDFELTST